MTNSRSNKLTWQDIGSLFAFTIIHAWLVSIFLLWFVG